MLLHKVISSSSVGNQYPNEKTGMFAQGRPAPWLFMTHDWLMTHAWLRDVQQYKTYQLLMTWLITQLKKWSNPINNQWFRFPGYVSLSCIYLELSNSEEIKTTCHRHRPHPHPSLSPSQVWSDDKRYSGYQSPSWLWLSWLMNWVMDILDGHHCSIALSKVAAVSLCSWTGGTMFFSYQAAAWGKSLLSKNLKTIAEVLKCKAEVCLYQMSCELWVILLYKWSELESDGCEKKTREVENLAEGLSKQDWFMSSCL